MTAEPHMYKATYRAPWHLDLYPLPRPCTGQTRIIHTVRSGSGWLAGSQLAGSHPPGCTTPAMACIAMHCTALQKGCKSSAAQCSPVQPSASAMQCNWQEPGRSQCDRWKPGKASATGGSRAEPVQQVGAGRAPGWPDLQWVGCCNFACRGLQNRPAVQRQSSRCSGQQDETRGRLDDLTAFGPCFRPLSKKILGRKKTGPGYPNFEAWAPRPYSTIDSAGQNRGVLVSSNNPSSRNQTGPLAGPSNGGFWKGLIGAGARSLTWISRQGKRHCFDAAG